MHSEASLSVQLALLEIAESKESMVPPFFENSISYLSVLLDDGYSSKKTRPIISLNKVNCTASVLHNFLSYGIQLRFSMNSKGMQKWKIGFR